MKRKLSNRRSSTADPGAAKRQKRYSTRVTIPWEEQKALGRKFADVGEGSWPIRRILDEKGVADKKKYKVEWETHPKTGEEFEPTWEPYKHLTSDAVEEWKQLKKKQRQLNQDPPSLPQISTNIRRTRNRRIIPDSSGKTEEYAESDVPPSTPSLGSGSSNSGAEIQETQEPAAARSLPVQIPPLPLDKIDYETLRSSQVNTSSSQQVQRPQVTVQLPESPLLPATRGPQSVAASISSSSLTLRSSARKIVAINGDSPLSRAADSSPRTTSSRSGSKLAVSTVPDQINGNAESSSPPLPSDPIIQLPRTTIDSPVLNHTSTTISPSLSRLHSPFQESSANCQVNVTIRPSSPRSATSFEATSKATLTSQRLSTSPRTKWPSRRLQEARETSSSIWPSLPGTQLEQVSFPTVASPSIAMFEHREGQPDSPAKGIAPVETLMSVDNAFDDNNDHAFTMTIGLDTAPLTIQQSIEEESESGTDTSPLIESKGNSSQESLANEREIETVDGVMIPARPILGPNEYAVALPAEGKVKSVYDDLIKVKKKAILRFIGRKGSPGTADISSKRTNERNEMQELLSRLNDTTTHIDLGLPGTQTQYQPDSQENAQFTEYAGSKFVMLMYLIDSLKDKPISFTIFAQAGPLQDLLAEFISLKHVALRRHDRTLDASQPDTQGLSIDLLTTQSDNVHKLTQKPRFILAFDISFITPDPQMQSLRAQFGDDLPIIHLLVTNSAEHVDRCVPVSFTSNIRLKVVVRTAYLAAPNLGGDITYIADESDEPADGRSMTMSDFQRAVRKSPERKLALLADVMADVALSDDFTANWTLGGMPELKLMELDSPPKVSRASSRTPQPRSRHTATPISRATTPIAKRRMLEVDGEIGPKRLRLTPVGDVAPEPSAVQNGVDELAEARNKILELTNEVASMKSVLAVAEQKQIKAGAKALEWQEAHAELQLRYEHDHKATKKLQRQVKNLNTMITAMKERDEAQRVEKLGLKQQILDQKLELTQARTELHEAGGDIAQLESAREEARNATARVASLEKSLKTARGDFDFTRNQYQDASKQAADLATEVKGLEEQVAMFKLAADDIKRSLKFMNYEKALQASFDQAHKFQLEVKNREAVIRRLQEENTTLKSRRGVQTRGSSAQPANSPGPRSRQASPAPGAHLMPPSGSRASVLRNER